MLHTSGLTYTKIESEIWIIFLGFRRSDSVLP